MVQESKVGRRDFLKGMLVGAASVGALGTRSVEGAERRFRYGVVGSGNRSRSSHLPILKSYFPDIDIVALCDITPENLQKGLEICGPATKGYADHREMLAQHPDLDAVIVIVPSYKHAEITLHALEGGKHVLCEKPIATHLSDADQMISTAKQRGLKLQIGLQMRYTPVYERAAQLIQEGRIGKVEYVFASIFRGDWNPNSWKYTDPVTGVKTNWRFLRLTEGAALLEDGIHELDIIHWLVGAEPRTVQSVGGNNVLRNRETIDHAGLLIDFSNDVKCNFAFSLFTRGATDGRVMRYYGSEGELSIESASAILVKPYHGRVERIATSDDIPQPPEGSLHGLHHDSGTYWEHKAFQHSILTGSEPFCDGKKGRDVAHISLAATRSLRIGQPIAWQDESEL